MDTSSPSHEYRFGLSSPDAKAADAMSKDMLCTPFFARIGTARSTTKNNTGSAPSSDALSALMSHHAVTSEIAILPNVGPGLAIDEV